MDDSVITIIPQDDTIPLRDPRAEMLSSIPVMIQQLVAGPADRTIRRPWLSLGFELASKSFMTVTEAKSTLGADHFDKRPKHSSRQASLDKLWVFDHPWTIPSEAWSLVFPPMSYSHIASPINPKFNPDKWDRGPNLSAGDVIDQDTLDWTNQATQGLKSSLTEAGINVGIVLTPAMLEMPASKFIPKYLKGSVNRKFPQQLMNKTLREIEALAMAGDGDGQTAWKLIKCNKYMK
jgi:hypothetical protein